jgi:hypothetical protein
VVRVAVTLAEWNRRAAPSLPVVGRGLPPAPAGLHRDPPRSGFRRACAALPVERAPPGRRDEAAVLSIAQIPDGLCRSAAEVALCLASAVGNPPVVRAVMPAPDRQHQAPHVRRRSTPSRAVHQLVVELDESRRASPSSLARPGAVEHGEPVAFRLGRSLDLDREGCVEATEATSPSGGRG